MVAEPRRRLTTPAIAVALVVVMLNGWFATAAVRTLRNSQTWVVHTLEVITTVEQITGALKDAETGARGYLISGDPAYLALYEDALESAPKNLDTFARMTDDNAHQRPNVIAMRFALEQRFAMLQGSVDARRLNGWDEARALTVSGAGVAELKRISDIAGAMEGEERRLLILREEDARSNGQTATITTLLATVLDILLLLAMIRLFARERQQRLTSEETASRLAIANVEVAKKSEEIHQLNEELENRVRERTAELESTNRELEAFSYSVSHDLRAPLRTIDGFSLAIEEDYADLIGEQGKDYIVRVRTAVQRMGGLIDALLQLSRITRSEITRSNVDVSSIAEGVAANLRTENPAQTLNFEIEPGMVANADPDLLRVAFENLMGNAVKFSSKKPESHIRVFYDPAAKAFVVDDNGAGFDMLYADKLFRAFNRLHGDKDFKGSGIGLATVARVIRRHHGRIWAESQLGHGARFWFTLA